jgi:hypothetical protein
MLLTTAKKNIQFFLSVASITLSSLTNDFGTNDADDCFFGVYGGTLNINAVLLTLAGTIEP